MKDVNEDKKKKFHSIKIKKKQQTNYFIYAQKLLHMTAFVLTLYKDRRIFRN